MFLAWNRYGLILNWPKCRGNLWAEGQPSKLWHITEIFIYPQCAGPVKAPLCNWIGLISQRHQGLFTFWLSRGLLRNASQSAYHNIVYPHECVVISTQHCRHTVYRPRPLNTVHTFWDFLWVVEQSNIELHQRWYTQCLRCCVPVV